MTTPPRRSRRSTRAAASGTYPNLAAALAAAGPPRSDADVFGSCIQRLIDVARLRLPQPGVPLRRSISR